MRTHTNKNRIGNGSKCPRTLLYIGLLLLISTVTCNATTTSTLTIPAGEQNEITVEVYPANGNILFVWQPHELGLQTVDQQFAGQLAEQGIEVWLADLLEAWFLPNTASNMDRVPATAYAALIEQATKTGKRIIAAASGRGAIPMLRGLRLWQQDNPLSSQLAGVVMLSPKLFVETPDPGLAGELMPVVEATNSAIVILQPDKSPWFWKLPQTMRGLQTAGSDIYVWPVRGVRDRFYFRPDAFEHEKEVTSSFATKLLQATRLLTSLPASTRAPASLSRPEPKVSSSKKERVLEVYKGNPQPPAMRLPDLNDRPFDLQSLREKVVLVNFWASWCPPCVHEMPSMQRLADHFKQKPFTIVGVNMAEDKPTIQKFLRERVRVNFPIVMDRDGKALLEWKVFAFPTSYVIDKKGNIRYALFGGVEWDTPDIIQKIEQLLKE